MVSNSSSRSKGHRGKSFRCNICWAYREKFGPECQLNFLLSTACCRNSVTEGRRERYCFLYSFMTPGIISEESNCSWQICCTSTGMGGFRGRSGVTCLVRCRVRTRQETELKDGKQTQGRKSGYRKRLVSSRRC